MFGGDVDLIESFAEVATVFVIAGLVIEYVPSVSKYLRSPWWNRSPALKTFVHALGPLLVVGGIAGELRFHHASNAAQKTVIDGQQSKIIALESRLAPRRLNAAAQAAIVAELGAKLTGVKFALSALGAESLDLANDTGDALTAAGLIWVGWPMTSQSTTYDPARKTLVGNIALNGTAVQTLDPALAWARDKIVTALTASEFEGTHPEPVQPEIKGFNVVLIMIGTKRGM
jgi:hypothetical protein